MKYISTLIFAIALIWSWNLVHKESLINFETHSNIQLKLVEVIRQSVIQIKPLAKAIEILKISTAPINDHSIKAFFTYKFQEPDIETGELVEQQIDGEAVLRRNKSSNNAEDRWTMENVVTKTGFINFKEGILITPATIPGEENKVIEIPPTPSPSVTPAHE